MKMFKKATLLVLALGTAGALAACGGKGDGGIKGETLADEAAWVQALTDTSAATNATMSITVKGEERMGEFFEKGESAITAKVAEDKVYVYEKTDASWYFEEDGIVEEDEEHDEDQTYLATVDGVHMKYFKEIEQDWQSYEWDGYDFSATVGYVLRWYAEFDLTYVSGMYDAFENNNGTYTYTVKADDADYNSTVELKFVDGQLVWGRLFESDTDNYEGQTEMGTYEISFTITYGNTTIGALPGEEDSDGGESDDNGGAAGEPETAASEKVDAAGWDEAFNVTAAADNFSVDVMMGASLVGNPESAQSAAGKMYVADNKGYSVTTSGDVTVYSYTGNVDGKNYSWESSDGENWTCEQQGDAIDIDGAWLIEETIPAGMTFDTVTYDEDAGAYKYVIDETDYVLVKLNDGKISYIKVVAQEYWGDGATMEMVYVYAITSYGNATVGELPSIEGATDGEQTVVGGTTDETMKA